MTKDRQRELGLRAFQLKEQGKLRSMIATTEDEIRDMATQLGISEEECQDFVATGTRNLLNDLSLS